MTKEELMEWKHNPITQEVLDDLEDALFRYKEDLPYFSTNLDDVALTNAKASGFIEGLGMLITYLEDKELS